MVVTCLITSPNFSFAMHTSHEYFTGNWGSILTYSMIYSRPETTEISSDTQEIFGPRREIVPVKKAMGT